MTIPHVPCTNPESEPGHDMCTVLFDTGPERWCHTHRSLRADCPPALDDDEEPTTKRVLIAHGQMVPMVPASEAAARRDAYVKVIVQHQRTSISNCHCGGLELGESWAEHLADLLLGEATGPGAGAPLREAR